MKFSLPFSIPFYVLLVLVGTSNAHLESNYLPGYGFSWYPTAVCGWACYNSISSVPLDCPSPSSSSGHSHSASTKTPQCIAASQPFLTTLAYCLSTLCDELATPVWKREEFWGMYVTGDMAVVPEWTYGEALALIGGDVPSSMYNASETGNLNETVVIPRPSLDMQMRFMVMFDRLEMLQARYIFVILTIGFGIPIFFAMIKRLPFMTGILDKIKPYIVYPSTIGTYNVRPLPWLIGNAPTIGQSLYIALFFLLNLILSSVNYDSSQPHPWYFGPREETLAYIGYRTGHVAYALLPLLILFSSRNNFLLWITDWSYVTYILLHRWIARIFALQAIIHSITLLLCYRGTGAYPVESKQPYWLWGIVATVLTCVMLVLSHIYFRRLSYEIFLILHILMTVFVIAGCWYHVILKWGYNFYDNWLYAACAVWFFDRLIRVLRVAKNGMRRAVVTEIGGGYVRVDVPGIRWASRPGYVAYVYFPTLSLWKPWENHPFSINATSLFRGDGLAPSLDHSSADEGRDVEKSGAARGTVASVVRGVEGTAGVTLIVKKNSGMTSLLKSHDRLLTMIDGPYPHSSSGDVMTCDRVLLIGGGVGITGLIPWINGHQNVKLAWSVKASAEALVAEVGGVLKNLAEKEISVGERLDIERLLRREAEAGYAKVGVVVCGPGGMCDDVRAIVAALGRGGKTVFELEVDAFSW